MKYFPPNLLHRKIKITTRHGKNYLGIVTEIRDKMIIIGTGTIIMVGSITAIEEVE